MGSRKLPAIQFYIGDWFKEPSVQCLDLETRGAWFELLLFMHECNPRGTLRLNGKQMASKEVANLLKIDEAKANQILAKLLESGAAKTLADGTIINSRMYDNELKNTDLSEKRSQAGKIGGLMSGKTRSKTEANEAASSSISSSSSISLSLTTNPLIKIINENFPTIATMSSPVTDVQAVELEAKFKPDLILDVLAAMENYKGLKKKYRSAYLTVNNWCKIRLDGKRGQGGSKQTKEYSGIDRQKFNDFVNRRSRRDPAKS